jgi:hypothetical protein
MGNCPWPWQSGVIVTVSYDTDVRSKYGVPQECCSGPGWKSMCNAQRWMRRNRRKQSQNNTHPYIRVALHHSAIESHSKILPLLLQIHTTCHIISHISITTDTHLQQQQPCLKAKCFRLLGDILATEG